MTDSFSLWYVIRSLLLHSFFLCALSNWIHCVFICKSIWAGQICKKKWLVHVNQQQNDKSTLNKTQINKDGLELKKTRWILAILLLDCNPIFEVYFTSVIHMYLYFCIFAYFNSISSWTCNMAVRKMGPKYFWKLNFLVLS